MLEVNLVAHPDLLGRVAAHHVARDFRPTLAIVGLRRGPATLPQILMGQEAKGKNGAWSLLQGSIEEREGLDTAVTRILLEEARISKKHILRPTYLGSANRSFGNLNRVRGWTQGKMLNFVAVEIASSADPRPGRNLTSCRFVSWPDRTARLAPASPEKRELTLSALDEAYDLVRSGTLFQS